MKQRTGNSFCFLLLSWIPFLLWQCQTKNPENDFHVFTNGKIYTMDPGGRTFNTMVLKGGKIHALGGENLPDSIPAGYKKTDLKNQFVFPGLIEGHGHFLSLGEVINTLDLAGLTSWNEVLEKTGEYGRRIAEEEWIVGQGWHPNQWDRLPELTVEGYPLNKGLSRMFPEQPVILYHSSYHALIANKAALDQAGIGEDTPDPEGGRIIRDEAGVATGVLEENAMDLISSARAVRADQRSEKEKVKIFRKNMDAATEATLSYGITAFVDAGISFTDFQRMREYNENDRSSLRLWAMARNWDFEEEELLEHLPFRSSDDHFFVQGIKVMADGALGSNGAWMLNDYEDQPGWRGQNVTALSDLERLGEKCIERGLQYCTHAIGDRANREVLNIYEKIFQRHGVKGSDLRWRIEHAQLLSPEDIPRFSELGVIASVQTIHCPSDAPMVVPKIGEKRAEESAYVWQSLLLSGARLANGTDCPVESVNPFENLYAAVTRKKKPEEDAFYSDQKLTRDQALKSLTIWNAYACRLEEFAGSLETGKWADFMITDTDLMNCRAEDILKTNVLETWVAGKLKYRKDKS